MKEEIEWANQMALKRAIEESSAYTVQIRQGFPPDIVYQRILAGAHTIDENKGR